jgi:hypothetical protein
MMAQVIFKDANQFGKLHDDALTHFEDSHHLKLPEDYRAFLLKYNGGTPSPDIIDFVEDGRETSSDINYLYRIHEGPYWASLEYGLETFQGRIPEPFISIGYDAGGNQYLLGIQEPYRSKVYFWDHELESNEGEPPTFDNLSWVADSFTQWLEMLHEHPISNL